MGSSKPNVAREYTETGTEPEFVVSDIQIEDAGAGNVRVYAYASRHGTHFPLQFTAFISAVDLMKMARKAMHAAAEAHNVAMWETDGSGEAH